MKKPIKKVQKSENACGGSRIFADQGAHLSPELQKVVLRAVRKRYKSYAWSLFERFEYEDKTSDPRQELFHAGCVVALETIQKAKEKGLLIDLERQDIRRCAERAEEHRRERHSRP